MDNHFFNTFARPYSVPMPEQPAPRDATVDEVMEALISSLRGQRTLRFTETDLEFMWPGYIHIYLSPMLTFGFDDEAEPGHWRVVIKYHSNGQGSAEGYEWEHGLEFKVDRTDPNQIAATILSLLSRG